MRKVFPGSNREFGKGIPPKDNSIGCDEAKKIADQIKKGENVSADDTFKYSEHLRLCDNCKR